MPAVADIAPSSSSGAGRLLLRDQKVVPFGLLLGILLQVLVQQWHLLEGPRMLPTACRVYWLAASPRLALAAADGNKALGGMVGLGRLGDCRIVFVVERGLPRLPTRSPRLQGACGCGAA